MHFRPLLEPEYFFELSKIFKISVSCRIEAFSRLEQLWHTVLTEDDFLTGSPSSGVCIYSHRGHKVNFHSWICNLTPGCSDGCRELRSVGLIGWLNKREVVRIGIAGSRAALGCRETSRARSGGQAHRRKGGPARGSHWSQSWSDTD